MKLNINSIVTKISYFCVIYATAMYSHYVYHEGFLIRDIFICGGICIYAFLNPRTFCLSKKTDKYNIMTALPYYGIISSILGISLAIINILGLAHLSLIATTQVLISLLVIQILIDKVRYI